MHKFLDACVVRHALMSSVDCARARRRARPTGIRAFTIGTWFRSSTERLGPTPAPQRVGKTAKSTQSSLPSIPFAPQAPRGDSAGLAETSCSQVKRKMTIGSAQIELYQLSGTGITVPVRSHRCIPHRVSRPITNFGPTHLSRRLKFWISRAPAGAPPRLDRAGGNDRH
ncbi:MAG: hypothetical protein ACI8X5_003148 [Planctomycetota bacterium]|jgi:hypothetical protein